MMRLCFNFFFVLFWGLYGAFLFWFFAQAAEWAWRVGLL